MTFIKTIFEIPKTENCGIYMIYNSNTHMAYIGETANLKKRAWSHSCNLKNGTHPNKNLLLDYKKGHHLFFVVLEQFEEIKTKDELLNLEKLYALTFYGRSIKLYNRTSEQEIKDFLFYYMIYPKVKDISRSLKRRFGMELNSISLCGTKKLIEIFKF